MHHQDRVEAFHPRRVYQMLMKPKRQGGYGLPEAEARRYATYVARKKGVPNGIPMSKPKVEILQVENGKFVIKDNKEGILTVQGKQGREVPITFSSEISAQRYIDENKPRNRLFEPWGQKIRQPVGSPLFPKTIYAGEKPSTMSSIRQRIRQGRASEKQIRFYRRQFDPKVFRHEIKPDGTHVYRVNPSPREFDRQREEAILRAKHHYMTRTLPQIKRTAKELGGVGLLGGGYLYARHRNREVETEGVGKSSHVYDLLKMGPSPLSSKLLRGILYTGFIAAGVGGLHSLLRSGYHEGVSVPPTAVPRVGDSREKVKEKIDQIIDSSNVTHRTVSNVMDQYKKTAKTAGVFKPKHPVPAWIMKLPPRKRIELIRYRENQMAQMEEAERRVSEHDPKVEQAAHHDYATRSWRVGEEDLPEEEKTPNQLDEIRERYGMNRGDE